MGFIQPDNSTVVNKNTGEGVQPNTKLQNIIVKSDNHTANTSFVKCQSSWTTLLYQSLPFTSHRFSQPFVRHFDW